MKAEDSVMNSATKRQFIYVRNEPSDSLRGFAEDEALLCQAEISFKAGYEQAVSEGDAEGWCDGYRKGLKEVVGWVAPRLAMHKSGLMQTNIDYIEWRTQLKEWGIE